MDIFRLEATKHYCRLGTWGGASQKPTYLVSNKQWIKELGAHGGVPLRWTKLPPVKRYIDKKGRRRCVGTAALKKTQSAPQ